MKIGLISAATALLLCAFSSLHAATVLADELGYGISGTSSNGWFGDYTTDGYWGAGSQRSYNNDASNVRSGRCFVEFVITQDLINAANLPNATLSLGFWVDSIGTGVAGKPYTDGLDLRYYGISATNLTVNNFWGTAAVGPDQTDILATNAAIGAQSTLLSYAGILNGIKSATAGQRLAFGFINGVGTGSSATTPVSNWAVSQTYAFEMNHTLANYTLTIVPEPSAAFLTAFGGLGLLLRRRR